MKPQWGFRNPKKVWSSSAQGWPKLKHGRYTATLKKLESWDKSKRSEIVNRNICSRLKMYSPFSRACGSGNIDLVEYFIKVCKPNVECLSRQSINEHQLLIKTTPIGIAAAKGHFKIVELLIKHGAKINVLSSVRQFSPVFMACMNNHLEIVNVMKYFPPLLSNKHKILPTLFLFLWLREQ